MHNIETKWLEDFLALAKTQSFSQAARLRHVTQPAFSRRIKTLEQSVGAQLFERDVQPVRLSDAGQQFLPTARKVLAQLQAAVRQLSPSGGYLPRINFCAAHALTFTLMPELVRWIRQQESGFMVRTEAANVDVGLNALRKGECDFLLAFHDPQSWIRLDETLFPHCQLGWTRLMPVCKATRHGQAIYRLGVDQDVPYLAYTSEAMLGQAVRERLRSQLGDLSLKKVYETAMAQGLKQMVLAGEGVAWLPEVAIQQELESGAIVPCGAEQWVIPLAICLYRSVSDEKPMVDRLWQLIGERYGAV
ncbi:LysR family transcriptional regulator [Oceanospirillum sp.]|uniref:LysR family transcriptional regulator n=1 Tax=Oceanospirillum sp. TaxID=2021254 RepID=UPI003A8F9B3E